MANHGIPRPWPNRGLNLLLRKKFANPIALDQHRPTNSCVTGSPQLMTLQHVLGPIVVVVAIAGVRVPTSGAEPTQSPAVSVQWERLTPVSESFVQEVNSASRSIPDEIWRIVKQAGWRVRLADSVVGGVPSLRDVAPRGWPNGWTWDNTDAVHLPYVKQLVIAETRRNQFGQVVRCNRIGGVLRHELGHAFDVVGDQRTPTRSAAPEFLAAYLADLNRMNREQKRVLQYYLQREDAGPQETFAEAFGLVLGGGSDVLHRAAFEESFSSVIKYVRTTIHSTQQSSPPRALIVEHQATPAVFQVQSSELETRTRLRRRMR